MSVEMVTITVDGKEVSVPKGMMLVEAAKYAGVEIPVFCHHPKLDPAGVCRMCLVDVEGQRKPVTACTMPVSDGMVVRTDTEEVEVLQKGVIEFLLLNHPLDCPVCDKGGECPLQDNTYKWGLSGSRSLDPKFRRRKAVDLGQFIVLDEERCILCRRCTRFDDEISQEGNLIVGERAHFNVITTDNGNSFDSYFSGNTIELCPVGALTSDLYRFKSRPWDLARVPSVCTGCSVGCNINMDFRFGELLRVVSNENDDIDGGWLCDRGRFNYHFVNSENRITEPLMKKDGVFHPVSWEEALSEIATRFKETMRNHGSEAIGAIGGGRLSDEEAYLFQKAVRVGLGSPNIDWRVGEQYVASTADFPGTIADVSESTGILLVDVLPAERAPVLDLRIRRQAERGGATLAAVGPVMPEYRPQCHDFPVLPANIPAFLNEGALTDLFKGTEKLTVVWSGRDHAVGTALAEFLTKMKEAGAQVHLLIASEQSNARGAERYGAHPRLLPGYRSVSDDSARAAVEKVWGVSIPASEGLNTTDMLKQARIGGLKAMWLAGANLLNTYPDRALAEMALREVPFLVVQDLFLTETAELADIVLPVAAFPEKAGHYTALDGTVQHVEKQATETPGQAKNDGWIAVQIARALGVALAKSDQELRWEMSGLTEDVASGADLASLTSKVLHETAKVDVQRNNGKRAKDEWVIVPVEKLYAGGGTAYFDEGLRRARPKPLANIHPDDAFKIGVAEGDEISVSSPDAELTYEVVLSEKVMAGTVQVPKGLFENPVNAFGPGQVRVMISKAVAEEVS